LARSQPKQRESGPANTNLSFREARRTVNIEEELKDDSSRGGSKIIKTMSAAIM